MPSRGEGLVEIGAAFGPIIEPGRPSPSRTTRGGGLGDLRGRLDPGEAVAADHHDPAGVELVEAAALADCGLFSEWACSSRAGNTGRARGAPDGVDELVVVEPALAFLGGDGHGPALRVDLLRPSLDELDTGAGEQVGDPEVGELLTCRDLVHPQPLGEPARRVDDGHSDIAAPGTAGGPDRGDHAGVPGAEDDDVHAAGCLVGAHAGGCRGRG